MTVPVEWKSRLGQVKMMPPTQLLANPQNFRVHPKEQQDAMEKILDEIGFGAPILAQEGTDVIIDGHLRAFLAERRNIPEIPVLPVDVNDDEMRLMLATFDKISTMAVIDDDTYQQLIGDLPETPEILDILSAIDLTWGAGGRINLDGEADGGDGAATSPVKTASLHDRFVVPPFSVLDARQGYWRDRKQQWMALGLQSELGRGGNLMQFSDGLDDYLNDRGEYIKGGKGERYRASDEFQTKHGPARAFAQDLMKGEHVLGSKGSSNGGITISSTSGADPTFYHQKREIEAKLGHEISTKEFQEKYYVPSTDTGLSGAGTSVFDPVLCELVYRWFSPPGGSVLDPFAGGSVRGIVAHKLGRTYIGMDLSAPQIAANQEQARDILGTATHPTWINGDSRTIESKLPDEALFDLVFSCPPYADLEVYSDHPADLSNMDYEEFRVAYRVIIEAATRRLRNHRFACFVVGDVRDGRRGGVYRNFVSHTIEDFRAAGLELYNEMILVTTLGSLPVRVARQFIAGRKAGKTHQNVLVFVKGDPKKAVEACGEITIEEDFLGVVAEGEEDVTS